jgi:hypothetical protein
VVDPTLLGCEGERGTFRGWGEVMEGGGSGGASSRPYIWKFLLP